MDKLNRRNFIKVSSLATVGSTLLLSPLELFAAPVRRFTKKGKYNFFTSDDPNIKFFIYTEDDFIKEHLEFEIEKAFTDAYTPFRFLIVFFKESLDFNSYALKEICRANLQGKKFLWLSAGIESLPNIEIDNHNNQLKNIDVSFLNQTDISVEMENGSLGKIVYQPSSDSFVLNATNAKFIFFANQQKAFFNTLEIPLSDSPKFIDASSVTQINKNSGSVRFRTYQFASSAGKMLPIKPYSPFITKKAEDYNFLFADYFEENSFASNVDLHITLFPFRDFTNDSSKISYIELIPKTVNSVVYLNNIDQYGKRYISRDFSNFLCRLAICKLPNKNNLRYLFIPYNKLSLISQSSGKGVQALLGYSGTERILANDKTKTQLDIVFIPSKNIRINGSQDGLEQVDNSLTSKIWIQSIPYCIDADKSPIFENENNGHVTSNSKQVPYKPIEVGLIGDTKVITNAKGLFFAQQIANQYTEAELEKLIQPVIPLLSLYKNDARVPDFDNYLELEKVFSKIRLNNFRKPIQLNEPSSPTTQKARNISTKNYVTPQGFVRNSDQSLDFIKPDTETKNGNSRKLQFKINNVGFASHFYLSLNKEDVFFVLKPSMLKGQAEQIQATFSIRGFVVDLSAFLSLPDSSFGNDTYLIFKFSKLSFEDLRKDVSKWSNYGTYKKNLEILSNEIKEKIDLFPANDDYKYFNDTIKTDRNWNGVVIINIPIANNKNLPPIFEGLSSSQQLQPNEQNEKLHLKENLRFRFVAFPVNKTFIKNGKIEIRSTTFFGLIDYDLLYLRGLGTDYEAVSRHFPEKSGDVKDYRFVLSKLLVRFENSEIRRFKSYAFLQIPNLFEENISIEKIPLTNDDNLRTDDRFKENLIRLDGSYQKLENADQDEFVFSAKSGIEIKFADGNILKSIDVQKVSFSYVTGDTFRFDIDANAKPGSWANPEIISIDELKFGNIGLRFDIDKINFPNIKFDLSKLFVLPKIKFNCNGFLSSFPISFSHFEAFKLKKILDGIPRLEFPDFDFFKIDFKAPSLDLPDISRPDFNPQLFSFIFDFDLGTLGDLSFLKLLKGQLLVGWSLKGGFALGFKLNEPSGQGIHINLFGALKIDIQRFDLCSFDRTIDGQVRKQYVLRLINGRLTILGLELPGSNNDFSALIFANPGSKLAWLLSYTERPEGTPASTEDNTRPCGSGGYDPKKNKLTLGIGQRVGLNNLKEIRTVEDAIKEIKLIFDPCNDICKRPDVLNNVYKPQNNWLVASENIIPESMRDIIDLKFVFNDPVLYGIYISIIQLFSIDVVYKKLSDDLGIWSLEFALDPSIRTIDAGELVITLPNLGIDISTNGDWKLDVGFPKGNDWSRSCLVQLRPFVGWGGMYISRLKTASLSLFAPLYTECVKNTTIYQAGFAVRIGIGAYLDKGIFYVGASISVYGIMEGAFAFESGKGGLKQLLPDHFALMGRVGAIAELIGYVDFKIVKASIHIVLRIEIGLTLIYIKTKGLQPVPLYIEGEVQVDIDFTIACFKVFGHRICITIHLSFHAYVRFTYKLGGQETVCNSFVAAEIPSEINVNGIDEIPVIFIPTFTKTEEVGNTNKALIYQFAVPFFGIDLSEDGNSIKVADTNILKDKIVKPLFSAIFDSFPQMPKTYNDLRNALLGKAKDANGKALQFKFPMFKPTFIVGYKDLTTLSTNDKDKYFKLTDADIIKFQNYHNGDCTNKCLFRIIPIPISSKIKVAEKDKEPWNTTDQGFTIIAKGIFSDANTIENKFVKDAKYTQQNIGDFEKRSDGYKTQNSADKSPDDLPDGLYDIREDVIVSEYFRMIGLVALEAYYNFLSQFDEKRTPDNFNPLVDISRLFFEEIKDATGAKIAEWSFNDPINIEKIIAQINYYFNNGLRLKDLEDGNYKSIFSILKQVRPITDFIPEAALNYDDISIAINSNSSSHTVELKGDLFENEASFKEFVNGGNKLLKINNEEIIRQFSQGTISDPYELVDVKLQIQNSKIRYADKITNLDKYGFFSIPSKIKDHFKDGNKCQLHLQFTGSSTKDNRNYQSNETPQIIPIDNAVCTNVELSLKPRLSHDKSEIIALEFSDVLVDELILINAVKNEIFSLPEGSGSIKAIAVYLINRDNKIIAQIPTQNLLLIKTNLSPKTHPPIIFPNSFTDQPEPDKENYYATFTSHKDFVRLMWEGMTTNNGGYYFVSSDKTDFKLIPLPKADDKHTTDVRLIISYEFSVAGQVASIPGYSNYFKISNKSVKIGTVEKMLFEFLEANNHYLYTNVKLADGLRTAKEYHSTLPAHCLSFEIKRKCKANNQTSLDQSSTPEEALHYIPLDFQLTQNNSQHEVVIDRNSIIPLMPKTKKKDQSKSFENNVIQDYVFYNHITPVIKYNNDQNVNRYDGIGKEYGLNFSLRDIYGFRTIELNQLIPGNYKHCYFDKIVPVNSWPIIKTSFWFHDIQGINSSWRLKFQLFEKGEIDNLLKDPESVQSVLNTLFTVKAQLSDKLDASNYRFKIYISNPNPEKPEEKTELKDEDGKPCNIKLISLIDRAIKIANGNATSGIAISFSFSIPLEGFRTILNPHLIFQRDAITDLFVKLPDNIDANEQWEFETVKYVRTKLTLSDNDKRDDNKKLENSLLKLNDLFVNTAATKNFCIGVGVIDNTFERVPFLLKKSSIEKITSGIRLIPKQNYFGIRPYSTKLWSGSYREKKFSDFDLDIGLKIILTKIDDILSPSNIQSKLADIGTLNKLIECKKLLVKGQYDILDKELKIDKLSGELSDKVENLENPQSVRLFEFESILLEKLQNFYNYDGVINMELKPSSDLQNHRLTISLNNVEKKSTITGTQEVEINKSYQLQSSKLDYRNNEKISWTTLFNYIPNDADEGNQPSLHNFSINPIVTHIEYNINKNPHGDGIEDSTWIQLLTPIHLDKVPVSNFPAIIRKYPPKPTIVKNEAIQATLETENTKLNWDVNLGKWQYILGLKDDKLFLPSDKIHIKFRFQTTTPVNKFTPDDFRNFEGFISYYCQEGIIDNKLNEFTEDLYKELSKITKPEEKDEIEQDKKQDIVFEKKKEGWNVFYLNPETNARIYLIDKGGNKLTKGGADFQLNELKFYGPNIFKDPINQPIISIKPLIWATRNDNLNLIPNRKFQYTTPVITPATWATIHLKFNNSIKITKLQNVFKELTNTNKCLLPLKMTAKYLMKTGNLDKDRQLSLPTLSEMHMEFLKGAIVPNIDLLFGNYDKDNGYPAISLTVSNEEQEGAPNDLPVFNANTIFKLSST
jgi:hypothetical protein